MHNICPLTYAHFQVYSILFWGSAVISLLNLHKKEIVMYRILAIYAASQFSLHVKQAVLFPESLKPPILICQLYSDWPVRKSSVGYTYIHLFFYLKWKLSVQIQNMLAYPQTCVCEHSLPGEEMALGFIMGRRQCSAGKAWVLAFMCVLLHVPPT